MTDELIQLDIPFGRDGRFRGETLSRRTLMHFQPQADLKDLAGALRESVARPLEFPELQSACVPGDKVVIALDVQTPRADAVIAIIWKQLSGAGVEPEDVTLLESPVWEETSQPDPLSLLPKDVQERIDRKRHDPTDENACGYLASTTNGERIYLAQEIIEADVVIPIGPAAFDPLLGYRGEASVLYPAFSNIEAIKQYIGQGHDELTPGDARPLRQQVDEVGWLLGVQFVMNLLPGRGTEVQAVFAGMADAVSRESRAALDSTCTVEVPERAELVLVAVESESSGHTWDQVARAIETARRIVDRDGRIVVLSQLKQKRGAGLDILSETRAPEDALKAIRKALPEDFMCATRIATAVDWANVYLRSDLPATDVEDLFIIPIESDDEVRKLLQGDETIIVIESAQKVFAKCQ